MWQSLTNLSVTPQAGASLDKVTNITGNVFVPETPEVFLYDADGNLTNDRRWSYTWDAENRLIQAESLSTAPTASKRKVEFGYDFAGRMIRRTESNGSSGTYTNTSDLKYLYDGWRCLAEITVTGSLLKRSYVWGQDISGTMDGAGGVGGLLSVTLHNEGGNNGAYFPWYDGNGNIQGYVFYTDGVTKANYEYGPFGEPIRVTGDVGRLMSFRFSNKRYDDTLDLLQYEYRFYKPSTGTWLSRDPIEEEGGWNVYGFLGNDGVNFLDPIGLEPLPSRSSIAQMSSKLQTQINNLPKEDFRRLFLNAQKCILDSLASGKCCLNPQDLEWLNRVVKTFMDPVFNALDGKPDRGWKRTFDTVASYQKWGNRERPPSDDYASPDPAWLWQMEAARTMALTHIQQDLSAALQKHGVGTDGEWKCIGNVVKDCEKKFFNGMERLIGKTLGNVTETYDVGKLRDNMRNRIKRENGSWTDPYSGRDAK